MQPTDPIPIIVDDRECRCSVMDALHATPRFEVSVQRLSVGDYQVDNRFLFERKTLLDLVSSIKSGRLFSQSLRLAGVEGLRPALVLEGTLKDLRGSGMSWEAVQGALVTVSLFLGLPLLRTRTADETARTFLYAAMQGRKIARGALPRSGFRPKGKAALQRHILQGLPGVGPERAARLLEHFGNIESILTAGEEALCLVPGVGTLTARAIRWAVKETSASYGAACDG